MTDVDDQPKRPLADDPSFLASLGDLDRGLDPEQAPRAPRSPVRPLTPAAPSTIPPAPAARPKPARPTLYDAIAPRLEEAITYETFYGLREKPFTLSTDPKFLYHSTTHDRVAQELLSAIRRRDALV